MIECLDRGHAGQSGAQGAFAHCLCFKPFYGPDGDPDPGFVRLHQHLRHLGAYAYIIVQTSRGAKERRRSAAGAAVAGEAGPARGGSVQALVAAALEAHSSTPLAMATSQP